MKKFLLIIALLTLFIGANAQKYYYPVADESIQGDTSYYPSSSGYDLRNIETGAFSFTFTHTDVADSLKYAGIEYRNSTDGTWTTYTGNAVLSLTSTDGQDKIYISTPLIDRYVRVRLSCAAGDTVAITSAVLMLKED